MELVLTEEQQALGKTAREVAAKHAPLSRLRSLRDAGDALGYDAALWSEMVALGWTAIPFSEDDGGFGLGLAEVAPVMEGLGRSLAASPYLSSVLLAGQVIAGAGSTEQRARWLPGLIEGEHSLALGWEERRTRGEPSRIAAAATPDGDGWRLDGAKVALDGAGAAAFVIAARTAGSPGDQTGISLFLVPSDSEGLGASALKRVDSRGATALRLDGVRVGPGALLGEVGAGLGPLEVALDRARIGLAAELLGSMSAVYEATLDYLKTRVQFGVPIGSFQALQHRAVDCFVQIELARTAVMAAARVADERREDPGALGQYASFAKARTSEAFLLVANEAVQLHGGIGMTDECDVGFFLKRARVAELTLGDASTHRRRWARLRGY